MTALALGVMSPPANGASVEVIREATGANAAAITPTVDAFRTDLGNPNNGGIPGPLATGRREINWDGVPDADAAPGRFPGDFFNEFSTRGAVFSTPGQGFQVSADAANPTATPVEFGNLNATYPTAFAAFSPQRLFTALGSNLTTVRFFIPGSDTPAGVAGFGAAFTDVDLAGSTRIEYFDDEGELILSRDVLATPGDASFSFFGVKASLDDPITSVRITSGAAAPGPNDLTQTGGNPDIAVMDDFIYGEPQPLPPPPTVQFAAPSFSGPEGGTATATLSRTGDVDEPAQVAFETRDGTARASVDYLPAGGAVSFAAGETSKTVLVNLLADRTVDGGEAFELALTLAAPGTALGSPATATIGIDDVPDTTRPSLAGLGVFPDSFPRGSRLPALAAARISPRILFRLSEDARVTFSFQRFATKRRLVPVRGTVAVNGVQGLNAVRFEGRISRSRKLGPGRYRLTAEAKDAAGNKSSRKRANFTILRR